MLEEQAKKKAQITNRVAAVQHLVKNACGKMAEAVEKGAKAKETKRMVQQRRRPMQP